MSAADADAMLRDAVLLERAGRIAEAISVYERLLTESDGDRRGAACGAVKTASGWQARQPVYQSSSGRWRNYAPQLRTLEAELADFTSGQPHPDSRGET